MKNTYLCSKSIPGDNDVLSKEICHEHLFKIEEESPSSIYFNFYSFTERISFLLRDRLLVMNRHGNQPVAISSFKSSLLKKKLFFHDKNQIKVFGYYLTFLGELKYYKINHSYKKDYLKEFSFDYTSLPHVKGVYETEFSKTEEVFHKYYNTHFLEWVDGLHTNFRDTLFGSQNTDLLL